MQIPNRATMMRVFQSLAMLLVLPLLIATSGEATDPAERPNIILMMADDLGWGDLQCYNPESEISAPHLDEMAASGLRFTRFYSAGPVCSPTRGSCLTGRHPYRYGVYSANVGHMRPQEITLPELLREQGYATGHFGKWHLGTLTTELKDSNRGGPRGKEHFAPPREHGYEESFVTEAKVPTYDPLLKPMNASRKGWDYLRDKSQAVAYGTRYWNHDGSVAVDNLQGDDSRVIMDRAIALIEAAADAQRPCFAAIWFHAPHLPVVAGPRHVAEYTDYDVYERNYYGCITALDEQVGRVRRRLRELGIAEDTLLWFCSDNGPEGQANRAPGSAGPLRGRKRSLYEGGVRVPGILEWPARIHTGRVTDSPAVTSDYLPTVLDLLDLELPDDRPLDGISLLPVIAGETEVRKQPIGFQSRKQQSLVDQRYKLYTPDAGQTYELYDLQQDPAEEHNLAADQPERVADLARQMRAWIRSCGASDAGMDYAAD